MDKLSVFIILCSQLVLILAAENDECGVIPMIVWAGENSRRTELLHRPVNLTLIQHTATRECTTDAECISLIKDMRSYFLNSGFGDIGMSFMIGDNGRVYEGTGWKKVGAHTLRYNDKSVSLSFIGNFSDKLPSARSLKAAQDLLSCGVAMGHLTKDYKVMGQRQLLPTLSPGDALQKQIETWPHWSEQI